MVHSQLRPGDTGSATGAVDFLRRSVARLPHSRRRTVLIRADRGFDVEALYTRCERRGWHAEGVGDTMPLLGRALLSPPGGACEEIAVASGGILGLGSRTSAEERAVIERVATEIQKTHEPAARRVTGSL
jgi:hypothetical protein